MGFRGGGYWRLMRNVEEHRADVTWALLRRVLGYAWPWRWRLLLILTILLTAGLGLLTPLIFRDLIDEALPSATCSNCTSCRSCSSPCPWPWAPCDCGSATQRRGREELIFELRVKLFEHLQGCPCASSPIPRPAN